MLQIRQINTSIRVGLLDLDQYASQNGIVLKREKEKAGTRYLIGNMLGSDNFELEYTPERKPFLKGRTEHLSISHSHSKLAVIINSEENTGIDVELIRDKVKEIEHKFLSAAESALAASQTENLISFWAAKETLYKLYGLKGLDFKKNLFIESFTANEIMARVETEGWRKRYRLACEAIEDYKLVYVLNEI